MYKCMYLITEAYRILLLKPPHYHAYLATNSYEIKRKVPCYYYSVQILMIYCGFTYAVIHYIKTNFNLNAPVPHSSICTG